MGATIGARLFQHGAEVVLIARGAHLAALRESGLRFIAPDGVHMLRPPVAGGPREIEWRADDVVLLTMKSQHTRAALEELAAAAPSNVPVVCVQNGVANERMALRCFANVYGTVVLLPALHLEPGEVVTHAAGVGGILDTGRFPRGADGLAEELTGQLTAAGFSAVADQAIMRQKYAKLLRNLGNALQAAVVGPPSPAAGSEAPADDLQVEIARLLRQEALECFAAAGIDCATAEEVRARRAGTIRMVEIEGVPRAGGSSWQSVARGTGDIEADYLNGEIVLLGALHGIATPANAICQRIARRIVSERRPVGTFTPQALMAMIEAETQRGVR